MDSEYNELWNFAICFANFIFADTIQLLLEPKWVTTRVYNTFLLVEYLNRDLIFTLSRFQASKFLFDDNLIEESIHP